MEQLASKPRLLVGRGHRAVRIRCCPDAVRDPLYQANALAMRPAGGPDAVLHGWTIRPTAASVRASFVELPLVADTDGSVLTIRDVHGGDPV